MFMPVSNMVNKYIQKINYLFSYLISKPAVYFLVSQVHKTVSILHIIVNKPFVSKIFKKKNCYFGLLHETKTATNFLWQ